MKADLIERLRARRARAPHPTNPFAYVEGPDAPSIEAADRIAALEAAVYEHKTAADAFEACWKDAKAALEAEASEGERRGLERGVSVASSWKRLTPIERQSVCAHFGWTERDFEVAVNVANGIADTIRALIPEAPAREGE